MTNYPDVQYILYDERAVPGSDTDDAQVVGVYDSIKEAKRDRERGYLYRVRKLGTRSVAGLPEYGHQEFVCAVGLSKAR